jgi:hypothetical protein
VNSLEKTMTSKQLETEKGFDFSKKNKVSVWVSQHPYSEIPDAYFEESFTKNETRATNLWTKHFKIRYFKPEMMETNGAQTGLVNIRQAAGECSFSTSFIDVLMSKARKKKQEEISWIVLLFEYEYSVKLSGVESDEFLTFLGAFDYNDDADNVIEIED